MGKFKFWFIKNAPTILITSGIVNSLASIIFASFATKKLPKVTTPVKKEIVRIHADIDTAESMADEKPEESALLVKNYKTELRKLYVKTGFKIVGMYLPSALSFGLSTASIIGSHNIMKGRNAALAAAFTTLKGGYDAYRERVKEKIGDTAEEALYEGVSEKKVTEVNENGKKVTKTVKNIEDDKFDHDFSIFWGPGNTRYDKVLGEANLTTLLQIERTLNQLLEAQGYLFLSDVYEALGVSPNQLGKAKLQASRAIGWIYDRNNPNGDNYISFGLHDTNGEVTKAASRFAQGLEDFILLDFNYDGDILTGDYGARTFMDTAIECDK